MSEKITITNVKVGKIGNNKNPSYYFSLPKNQVKDKLNLDGVYTIEAVQTGINEKKANKVVDVVKDEVKNENDNNN